MTWTKSISPERTVTVTVIGRQQTSQSMINSAPPSLGSNELSKSSPQWGQVIVRKPFTKWNIAVGSWSSKAMPYGGRVVMQNAGAGVYQNDGKRDARPTIQRGSTRRVRARGLQRPYPNTVETSLGR
jgi:hypothetical protein